MKRIAIPVSDGKLCGFLGKCSNLEIYDLDPEGNLVKQTTLARPEVIRTLPDWAGMNGITDIIAYSIDRLVISEFIERKINIYIGAPIGISPDDLIEDFLSGNLKSSEKVIRTIIS